MKTVITGLSGGVDSIHSALILKEQGFDVIGAHMVLSAYTDQSSKVEKLANFFDIPLIMVDLKETFENKIINYFVESYVRGLTPNPCVVCNPHIKFWTLYELSESYNDAFLATGHYVEVIRPEENPFGRYGIKKHRDTPKDQSYFLYGLSQEILKRALFPLGNTTKKEVQGWVLSRGIENMVGPESQEICFIPEGNYGKFLESRLPYLTTGMQGPIIDMEGRLLGYHKGIHKYTIGQRRGLGLPSTEPYYVVEIDTVDKVIYVGRRKDLYRKDCFLRNVNYLSMEKPDKPFVAEVKIRNQHIPAKAIIEPFDDGKAYIQFNTPQPAVTPGQSAVFYEENLLLGGGIIEKTFKGV